MIEIVRKRYEVVLVFILGSLICLINLVSAASIVGVSPASIHFPHVMRGGYSERSVLVSVDVDKEVEVVLNTSGEIKDWLNLSVQNFSVSNANPVSFLVSIMPPEDIPNGNYTGFVRITTSGFGEGVEGHAVSIIRSFLDLKVSVEITDQEVISCVVSNLIVYSAEKGENIIFNFNFKNYGNVRLGPRVEVNIWDQDQTSIVKSEDFSENSILPTKEKDFSLKINSLDLDLDQYWAEVFVPDCYTSEVLTFDILEPGALTAKGVLMGIVNQKKANVSETVPISARFKNIGQKEVSAQFKGKVTFGSEIVEIIESPEVDIAIAEIMPFDFYFTPKKPGKYIISGRVFYSGKRTFESSSSLEVVQKSSKFQFLSQVFLVLIYVILIFIIIIFLYKIRREKRIYSIRLRKITRGLK